MTVASSILVPTGRRRVATSPVPAPSRLLIGLFSWYARRYIGKHFSAVRLSGAVPVDPGTPLVFYLNHPGWWDPLAGILLARTFFGGRTHYVPIDAAALETYRFFRKLGFFGVHKNQRRGGLDFLRGSMARLALPNSALWVTAQGEFTDPRVRPIRLLPGLAHLARHLDEATFIPIAIEYPFWHERTPEMLFRFGEPILVRRDGGPTVADYQERFERALTATADALARDAIAQEPARFTTVLQGRRGVGGVYDLYRRVKGAVLGEKFSASHDAAIAWHAGTDDGKGRR